MRKVELHATARGATAREALGHMMMDLLGALSPTDCAPIVVQARVTATHWPPEMKPIRGQRCTAEGKVVLMRPRDMTPVPGSPGAVMQQGGDALVSELPGETLTLEDDEDDDLTSSFEDSTPEP